MYRRQSTRQNKAMNRSRGSRATLHWTINSRDSVIAVVIAAEIEMLNCVVCNDPCDTQRAVRVARDDTYGFERHAICNRCHIAVKKRPSPSKRGRQRDRDVAAQDTLTWIEALRRSWSITNDCFRCELSGLKLDLDSAHRPLSMGCDHDPPGSDTYLVVAWLVNDMKNDHDREEFYRNIKNLAKIVGGGRPDPALADKHYDDFAKIRHWRRV